MGRVLNKLLYKKELNRKKHNIDNGKSGNINKNESHENSAIMETVENVFPDPHSQNQARGLVKEIINLTSDKDEKEFILSCIEKRLKNNSSCSDKKQQIVVPKSDLHKNKDK